MSDGLEELKSWFSVPTPSGRRIMGKASARNGVPEEKLRLNGGQVAGHLPLSKL